MMEMEAVAAAAHSTTSLSPSTLPSVPHLERRDSSESATVIKEAAAEAMESESIRAAHLLQPLHSNRAAVHDPCTPVLLPTSQTYGCCGSIDVANGSLSCSMHENDHRSASAMLPPVLQAAAEAVFRADIAAASSTAECHENECKNFRVDDAGCMQAPSYAPYGMQVSCCHSVAAAHDFDPDLSRYLGAESFQQ
jgi:hypothetical protein